MRASQLEDNLYVTLSTDYKGDHCHFIECICRSAGSAAHNLGVESAEQLLQHSVKMTTWRTLWTLCHYLPGAQALSPTAAGALLLSALEVEGEGMVAIICRNLPAARRIDVACYRKVLLRAVELKQLTPICALLGLPAAEQLPGTALDELLAAALKADMAAILHRLCELPGAEQVDHGTLVELISAAEGAWTDNSDFSRQKPDRALWSLADLKSLAEEERGRRGYEALWPEG